MAGIGCQSKPKSESNIPSLEETFSATDTIPLGTSAAFQLANRYFQPQHAMLLVDEDFRSFWQSSKSDNVNIYISITGQFFPTENEWGSLLGFLQGGRSAFISAGAFPDFMLDTLGVEMMAHPLAFGLHSFTESSVSLDSSYFEHRGPFTYFYRSATRAFRVDSNIAYRVLGYNSAGEPNFIHVFVGDGHLFLHAEPEVFSNYFLMQQSNALYALSSWRYLPGSVQDIAWDDFYQQRKYPLPPADRTTGLGILLRHPGMRSAWWLALILFGLYLWFGSKRKQRIIPVIPETKNTSVAFAETMGRLYLQQHNNRNLADKIIRYFQEQLRQRYYVQWSASQSDLAVLLSRKTSVPLTEVEQLFSCIRQVEMAADVSDELLLRLNSYIENFYKKRQA